MHSNYHTSPLCTVWLLSHHESLKQGCEPSCFTASLPMILGVGKTPNASASHYTLVFSGKEQSSVNVQQKYGCTQLDYNLQIFGLSVCYRRCGPNDRSLRRSLAGQKVGKPKSLKPLRKRQGMQNGKGFLPGFLAKGAAESPWFCECLIESLGTFSFPYMVIGRGKRRKEHLFFSLFF